MVSTVNWPSALDSQRTPASAGGIGAARQHLDPVGDDEGRIEADAELADQLRILLLVAGQALEELGGARLGDGAQVRDRFVAAHADAVVADRQGAGLADRHRSRWPARCPCPAAPDSTAPGSAACRWRPRRSRSARAGKSPCGCTGSGSSAAAVRGPPPGSSAVSRAFDMLPPTENARPGQTAVWGELGFQDARARALQAERRGPVSQCQPVQRAWRTDPVVHLVPEQQKYFQRECCRVVRCGRS